MWSLFFPLEGSGWGCSLEISDLTDVQVGFVFESLNVHWDDNVSIGNGTSHFSHFLEDNLVFLGWRKNGEDDEDGDHGNVISGWVAVSWLAVLVQMIFLNSAMMNL